MKVRKDNTQQFVDVGLLGSDVDADVVYLVNSVVYANVKAYGAVGDGITDDSNAVTAAIATGRPVFFPSGTYLVTGVTITSNISIKGAENAVIIPKYIDGIAQNIFTIRDTDEANIENIIFSGVKHNATDMTKYRQSAIEAINLDCLHLKDVTFDVVDDSSVQWETMGYQRKGVALTAHDVDHVLLEHVHYNNMGSDEVNWIANQTKSIDDIRVDIINCSSSNMYRLSLFDIFAHTINIDNFYSDESDDFQTYSWSNLFGKYIHVSRSVFNGSSYGNIVDTYEMGAWKGVELSVDKCILNNSTSAITSAAKRIYINECTSKNARLLEFNNVACINQSVIDTSRVEDVYATYSPSEEIVITNCTHTNITPSLNSSITNGFLLKCNSEQADVKAIVKDNYIDLNNIKGNAAIVDGAKDFIASGNTIINPSYTASSSARKAAFEIVGSHGCHNAIFESNFIDSCMIVVILSATVQKIKLDKNIVRNYNGDYYADNVGSGYKVGEVESDTSKINLYSDNYTRPRCDYYEASWTAAASSANGTELTDRITVPPGVYIVSVSFPVSSSDLLCGVTDMVSNVLVSPYTTFHNYGDLTTICAVSSTAELCVTSASSYSVTFSNTSGAKIKAVPIKFGA